RMIEAERQPDLVRKILTTFQSTKGARLPKSEYELIDRILHPEAQPPTLVDGLGLFNPKERSPVAAPKKKPIRLATAASLQLLKQLDALIHENRDKTFVRTWQFGSEEVVLGTATYHFPSPDRERSAADDLANLPLADLWLNWYDQRPASTRDSDNLEPL